MVEQVPSNSLSIDVQDRSTATPLEKLRRFLLHLAGHDRSPYFYGDGFPRPSLNQDAAEFVKLVDAIAQPTPEPEPAPHSADHLTRFTEWLVKEMPAGTVIGDPAWWARKLLAGACVFADEAPDCKQCDELIGERDRAQDALQDTHIALGGSGEWLGRSPPQPVPESGDLHLDVPELARERMAELERLRAAQPPEADEPSPGLLRSELKAYLQAIGAPMDGLAKQSITAFLMWMEDRATATKGVQHAVTCKQFPDPHDEREPAGPCTCSDCPPVGYPTNKTRCAECPRLGEEV